MIFYFYFNTVFMNTINTKIKQKPSIREIFQQREHNFLSRYGTPSTNAERRHPEITPGNIRTPFQLDRDRIVYSNAFRRLKYKTQVFLSPLGDHYRTRLTHTLEVSETARNIARAMRLNEDLAEAVALGHDLGHTPLWPWRRDSSNPGTFPPFYPFRSKLKSGGCIGKSRERPESHHPGQRRHP